jgi:uncharacterized membrane protein YbjE (DUF340 family)
MKASLFIISFFAGGLILGIIFREVLGFDITRLTDYALYALLFLVGINLGSDPKFMEIIRSIRPRIFLLPLSTIIGTLLGVVVYHLIFGKLEFGESLAVGFGFGYYSLSSIILTKLSGESLGVIALLANISREVITLLLAPLFARFTGKLSPIAAGGATSMDTTLPIIIKSSGKEYLIHSMMHGVILTILVPFLVSLAIQFF